MHRLFYINWGCILNESSIITGYWTILTSILIHHCLWHLDIAAPRYVWWETHWLNFIPWVYRFLSLSNYLCEVKCNPCVQLGPLHLQQEVFFLTNPSCSLTLEKILNIRFVIYFRESVLLQFLKVTHVKGHVCRTLRNGKDYRFLSYLKGHCWLFRGLLYQLIIINLGWLGEWSKIKARRVLDLCGWWPCWRIMQRDQLSEHCFKVSSL